MERYSPAASCSIVVSFNEDYDPDFVFQDDYMYLQSASYDQAESLDPDICKWRKHLQLQHLIKCVEGQVQDTWPRLDIYIG